MRRWTIAMMAAVSLTACGPSGMGRAAGDGVISLDYCADQMVLGLVPKDGIRAVSIEAASDPWFAGPRAAGLPRVTAQVEAIVALRPAVVVRSFAGGPTLRPALERAGIRVVDLPYAATLAEVRGAMLTTARQLGQADRGAALTAEYDAALAAAARLGRARPPQTALYITPGDVTTGPQTLVADMMAVANLAPYRRKAGWGPLPLETLVRRPPDHVIAGFFNSPAHRQDHWSGALHPVARRLLTRDPVVVPGGSLACGNWLAGDAVLAMAGGQSVSPGPRR